jgi:isocitrate dehydrogenase (NAD+)
MSFCSTLTLARQCARRAAHVARVARIPIAPLRYSRTNLTSASRKWASSISTSATSMSMPMSMSMHQRRLAHTVTLMPGDGIGPEIAKSVQDIFKSAGAPVEWEIQQIGTEHVLPGSKDLISPEAIESVKRNKVGLKGPFATPIGSGHRSLNLTLRKALNLYANVRPCKSIPGYETRYSDVDLVTIRENTEGEYSGLEHEAVPGVVENLKVITREASARVAKYAFEYATKERRPRVTAVHKATVMKLSDGLFLECCREIAAQYPDIQYDELQIDTACVKLVRNPASLDVMVMPNLYGDIVSDLCAGLIGGLGLTASGNIGVDAAVFEAVHGTAPDIAGHNKANPTALLLSACMMLRHLKEDDVANRIEKAVLFTIGEEGTRTGDLGGTASCTEFTDAVCRNLSVVDQ